MAASFSDVDGLIITHMQDFFKYSRIDMVETGKNGSEVRFMKKHTPTYREELLSLRQRMENLETKLALINEPMLVDALSYELLGLQARLNFLIATAKEEQQMAQK